MQNRPPRYTKTDASIGTSELARAAQGWLLDCEIRQHSNRTLDSRKSIVDKLIWFLKQNELPVCGTLELRQFLAYLTKGHERPGGRWGNAQMTKAVRPRTVHTYHGHLRTLFRWLIQEGILEASPMEAIVAPIARADQVQPFDERQVAALIGAAQKTIHGKRDYVIVCFLLDTGLRASELCGLKFADLDMAARKCVVLGKGNKHRAVYFGRQSAKALWNYLREEQRDPGSPVFQSDRGGGTGEPLTRSGLLQLIERLGRAAHIEAVRCSPHTFHHTFAVTFLRNGGNVFTLQQILGHTSLQMTNRYVAVSQGDIEKQSRQFSPVDCLGRR